MTSRPGRRNRKLVALVVCVAISGAGLASCGRTRPPSTAVSPSPLPAAGAAPSSAAPAGPAAAESATPPTAVTSAIKVTDATNSRVKVTNFTETDSEDGSYVSVSSDGSDDEAFDSSSRTSSSRISADGHGSLNTVLNSSSAPPDAPTRQVTALADFVTALQTNGDPSVSTTTRLGRTAYRAQFNVSTPGLAFDHADVTIDAQTGLMLVIDTTKDAKPYIRYEVTSFVLNPAMAGVNFVLAPQKQDDVNQSDAGFVDTQLDLVKAQVGYDPITPRLVPAGMALTRVMTHAAQGETSGANGVNPQNQGVVVEVFSAGWRHLDLTLRKSNGDATRWSDPLATVPGEFVGAVQPLTITAGLLAPAKGESVLSPAEVPHVWAVGSALVVTVSGPFTAATLVAAANSFN